MNIIKLPLNLQMFSDPTFDVNALDALLSGNTTTTAPEETKPEETKPEGVQADAGATGTEGTVPTGGDPSLESTTEKPAVDEGAEQQKLNNAAFARLRTENAQKDKTLQQLAKALGIAETDPNKLGDLLINMAQEKLAKEANVPIELYKELNSTKEQLAAVQFQQNQITARDKLLELKTEYGLDDKELMAFAGDLDKAGISLVTNPDIDLSYEYYKRNREALEKKRVQAAVEEALKKDTAADKQSSKPESTQGKPTEPDAKVNNVAALNAFLDGK